MEAIFKTDDKNLFQTVLNYLKSLHITVETKKEKSDTAAPQKQSKLKKKTDEQIHAFYDSIRIDMSKFKFNRDEANER